MHTPAGLLEAFGRAFHEPGMQPVGQAVDLAATPPDLQDELAADGVEQPTEGRERRRTEQPARAPRPRSG